MSKKPPKKKTKAPEPQQVFADEWVLVCSGPSAAKHVGLCAGRRVACVNGSWSLLKDRVPDAYGMFEFHAWDKLGPKYMEFATKGVRCVTRPDIIEHQHATGESVPFRLGWDQTRMPRLGESEPRFLNSGVCMLLWLTLGVKPKRIHVIGMDGYRPEAMYAEGVTTFAADRDEAWCVRQNGIQLGHLRRIKALAGGVELVFHGAQQP